MAKECNHQEGPQHDCEYVDARNALMPEATRAANADVQGAARSTPEWTRSFMAHMNRLAAERGISRSADRRA